MSFASPSDFKRDFTKLVSGSHEWARLLLGVIAQLDAPRRRVQQEHVRAPAIALQNMDEGLEIRTH